MMAAGSYHHYRLDTGPIDAVEFQIGAPYYPPIDFRVGKVPVAPFLDAIAGVLNASAPFPAGGTEDQVHAFKTDRPPLHPGSLGAGGR